VQTIAAFASLHVGMCVTMCLLAELLRLPHLLRAALWAFMALTVLATVYLGWHYFVDDIAGVFMGAAALALARALTGLDLRAERERRRGPVPAPSWEPAPQPAGASARSN